MIDHDAAGWGWFVDQTPDDDLEFDDAGLANESSEAAGRMDLLSVVMHELRHVLGEEHGHEEGDLEPILNPGVRIESGVVSDDLLDLLAGDQSG